MKPGTAAVLFGVTLLIGGAFLANSTMLPPASSQASAGDGVTPSPAPLQENLLTATLEVNGMWCGSCSYMVTKVLVRTPGVVDAKVSMRTKTANRSEGLPGAAPLAAQPNSVRNADEI